MKVLCNKKLYIFSLSIKGLYVLNLVSFFFFFLLSMCTCRILHSLMSTAFLKLHIKLGSIVKCSSNWI